MQPDYGSFEETQLGGSHDIKMLRRLYPFVAPHRKLIFGSILLVVLITLLDLALPYLTKVAIDRYIVPQVAVVQSAAGGRARKERVLAVDLQHPDVRDIVARYPGLFTVEGSHARIALEDMDRLSRSEILLLRQKDLVGLTGVSAAYLLLIAAGFLLNFFQRLIMEYTGHQIMHRLRSEMYSHIQSLSLDFFPPNRGGRWLTRDTNDVQNMHELFTSVISFIFKDLFLLAGIAGVLIALNWKLALATFSVLPPVVVASAVFSVKARAVFRRLRIKIAEINTRFSETIGGMKVIQLFGAEKLNFDTFQRVNHENYQAGMQQIQVMGVFLPAVEVLGFAAVAIVVFYGGTDVAAGALSLGSLVAFISYMKMFFRPIRDMAEKYNILQDAMASAERIFLILDTRSRIVQPLRTKAVSLPSINEIVFENVDFGYLPGEPVLNGINFRVRSGETIGIVGPTGSGKTTLIHLMVRFYDPTSGCIRINGHDLRRFATADFRSRIALVMQDPFLFSESIRSNIFRGDGKAPDADIARLLQDARCDALLAGLPDGADTVLSEGGASISSGERQLISIARAFARDPELIIFDEATSYIDSRTERQVQLALGNLMKGRTSIIVAHRLSTVRRADRILALNRGRIIESGTHAELLRHRGFYYRLLQLQG
jgi:ATP-binding cassette subfamily B multidrug efflux pump